ncbi:UDP-N-acetylmuramoyl-L-alanine--D-glutamate ligase [Clostridium minihomine]|uniref:UDP-N-acetylmuramoyl-L-alanine--D-glutamate ligase n=1 Tax=Clostridium minihomine TaxID=2045012 RepID=UPI000C788D6D|nr:UDP-N-acetylmuramoyl-L-alanine--D-glutamate ligase [Clostridium minihomine]
MDSGVQTFFQGLSGKKVAFCGIGASNLPLIQMFSEHGALVQACDRRQREQLGETAQQLEQLGVELRLGESYLQNLDADMIFRTPGMRFFTPELEKARKEGRAVTSEMEVFFDLCPCKIYGVTGSDGKTTTTTIISKLLEASGKTVHLGGNIGKPLLPEIASIRPDDVAVVELSSFQLISMRKGPDVAIVTNVSPNHLDIHKDMTEYVEAKKNIVLHQTAFSRTVINGDNSVASGFAEYARGQVCLFSRRRPSAYGAWLREDGMIVVGKDTEIMPASTIRLPGMHNVENYLAAISAVWGEVDAEVIRCVAAEFSGVQHRMELVREVDGVKYYNDSIGTSPTRTISGTLSVYPEKIILLAGGYDKHLPFAELGVAIVDKVKLLILMGQTADKIEESVTAAPGYRPGCPEIKRVGGMEEAVQCAYQAAKSGDIVSLSPACASFDQYTSFEVRGYHFKQLVNALPGTKKKEE